MTSILGQIDHYTAITQQLAISGQPSQGHFSKMKAEGVQMVVHLKIEELEPVVADEEQRVVSEGILYETLSVSFNKPSYETFDKLAQLLQRYQKLSILLHCNAGYCTSGLLIPYLVLYQHQSLEEATNKMIVQKFAPQWQTFITDTIATAQV
ncbi:MAG: hypothetical protein WBC91_08140 [Phototrophicaceae bacterium]